MTNLNIYLLGKAEISIDNRQLENHLSNKAIALISLLLLSTNNRISKQKLISYLWPDCDEDAKRYNLRYNLWKIKKLISRDHNGEEFLLLDKEYCVINNRYEFRADIISLNNYEANKDESLDNLLALKNYYRGDFLEGMYLKSCDDFNDKIIFERIIYQKKYVEILRVIASKYNEVSDYENAIRILNELSTIEPYNEDIAYDLLKAYINWGETTVAINFYRRFEATLKSNLSISPDERMKSLIERIINQNQDGSKDEDVYVGKLKQTIDIELFCVLNVDYFAMSEIIRLLLLLGGKSSFFGIHKSYIEDLNYIQNEVGIQYEKIFTDKCVMRSTLPEIRIVNSFIKAISHVSIYYNIHIKIINPQDVDNISGMVLIILQQMKIDNLLIVNSD